MEVIKDKDLSEDFPIGIKLSDGDDSITYISEENAKKLYNLLGEVLEMNKIDKAYLDNPCDNCKLKNIDWKKFEEFKDCDSNPMCCNCYKKECYKQSLKPTHKVIVELADNEILVKYTIKDEDMQDFIGRTTQLSNYVCGTPIDVNTKVSDAVFEDSIYSSLQDVQTEYSIIDAPIKVERYLDGEYQEVYLRYLGDKTDKIVDKFTNKHNKML